MTFWIAIGGIASLFRLSYPNHPSDRAFAIRWWDDGFLIVIIGLSASFLPFFFVARWSSYILFVFLVMPWYGRIGGLGLFNYIKKWFKMKISLCEWYCFIKKIKRGVLLIFFLSVNICYNLILWMTNCS